MRRAGGVFAASVVAVAMLLGGCGGSSPEPSGLGSKSASPKASATSASPKPSSSDDPVAFARAYVAAANVAVTRGEADQLRALSAPGCEFCEDTASSMTTFHENGGSYDGDPSWHITEVGEPTGTDPVELSMYVEVAPHKIVSKRGGKPRQDQGRTLLFDFTLAKENGQWKVKNLVASGG